MPAPFTQPPSQVLQEYPEMRPLQREFEALVGQRDVAGKAVNVLSPDVVRQTAPTLRRSALGVLAEFPPGRGLTLATKRSFHNRCMPPDMRSFITS